MAGGAAATGMVVTVADPEPTEDSQDEPNAVFHVKCGCGYSERFRWEEDARDVYEAHLKNLGNTRCRNACIDAHQAYPKGGVGPEKTLPYDLDEDPDGLTEPGGGPHV